MRLSNSFAISRPFTQHPPSQPRSHHVVKRPVIGVLPSVVTANIGPSLAIPAHASSASATAPGVGKRPRSRKASQAASDAGQEAVTSSTSGVSEQQQATAVPAAPTLSARTASASPAASASAASLPSRVKLSSLPAPPTLSEVDGKQAAEAWFKRNLAKLKLLAFGGHASFVGSYRWWVVEPDVAGAPVRALYERTAAGGGTYVLREAITEAGVDITHLATHAGGGGAAGSGDGVGADGSSGGDGGGGDSCIAGLPRAFTISPWGGAGGAAATASSSGGGGDDASADSTPPSASTSGISSFPAGPAWVEVRGVAYFPSTELQKVRAEKEAAGEREFTSARADAAAAVKSQDPEDCRRRRLSFIANAAVAPPPPPSPPQAAVATEVAAAAPAAPAANASPAKAAAAGSRAVSRAKPRPTHKRHWETLQWLQAVGFGVSSDTLLCGGPEEVVAEVELFEQRTEPIGDYEVDGLVVRLDDTELYGMLGSAPPRWGFAWRIPRKKRLTEAARESAAAAKASSPSAAMAAAAGGGALSTSVVGLRICVTGTLTGMKRDAMKNLLAQHGAVFHSTVKSDTQILILGQRAGAGKQADAQRRGVTVLTEQQFWARYAP